MFSKKPFLIAEIGLSHDGSLGIAKSFAKIAKLNGADAVKFQHHDSSAESSDKEQFRKKFSYQDKNRSSYWDRTSFSLDEWIHLKKYCDKLRLKFICSPFSIHSAQQLIEVGVHAWKIASGELNNLFLIDYIISNSKKPIILSTGLSTYKEIKEVIDKTKLKKRGKIAILQCTTEYPTKIKNAGHKEIKILNKKFNCVTGISDHTGNLNSLIYSITSGASLLEFHLTLNHNFFGPDTSSSILPHELKFLSKFRDDFVMMNSATINKKTLNKNQKKMRQIFNKSLYAKCEIKKNQKIKLDMLKDLKPGLGINVKDYKNILNLRSKKIIKKNSIIKYSELKKL